VRVDAGTIETVVGVIAWPPRSTSWLPSLSVYIAPAVRSSFGSIEAWMPLA